ncbi:MAG: hypothetical protein LBH19_05160 [Dysgonamonadaceae bacterium]|nr:hypothetical protein [Dysgonamonadaceae bacterium]
MEYLALHPCSFLEFLNVTGENRFVEPILNVALPAVFHDSVMQLFKTFSLVGGMPEALARSAENKYMVGLKQNFWVRHQRGSNAEVDLIYVFDGQIIPIEVKAGHNIRLKSLHLFMDECPRDWAVRVWSQPFSNGKVYAYLQPGDYLLMDNEFLLYNFTVQAGDVIRSSAI